MRSCLRAYGLVVLLCAAFSALAVSEPPVPYDQLPDNRVLYAAPGQSLSELVRRAYPERAESWPEIRQWIIEQNPHAFADGTASSLRGEVRLRLPRASDFAARQQAERGARGDDFRFVFDQRYLFVNPAQSLAELVRKVYPEQPLRWGEIIEAIQRQNGRDMLARDARRTIARGTRLSIPTVVETAAAQEEPVVGRVTDAEGAVTATDVAGRRRGLASGSMVRRGDQVKTGAGATVRIEMDDGERLDLRATSEVRVREWSLPETGPGRRVLELLSGGLRAITGAIGNRGGDDYRTVTATATLGVRGTDYALRVCEPGECRSAAGGEVPAGLYVGVAAGEIELLNAGGDATFAAGDYGYVASAEVAPARVDRTAAPAVYSADELEALGRSAGDDTDDGRSWWWATGLLLLLAL